MRGRFWVSGLAACGVVLFAWTTHAQDLSGAAFERATAAYNAIAKNDLPQAEIEARAVVALRPDSPAAARLLMDVLARQGNVAGALVFAKDAERLGAVDGEMLLARGFLKLQANDTSAAQDFERALGFGTLTSDQTMTARLGLAESASRAKSPSGVIEALAPLAAVNAYDVQARLGFAYFDLQKMQDAEAAFRAAVVASRNETERNTAAQAHAQALANLGRNAEALDIARPLSLKSPSCNLDLVYLLFRIGGERTGLTMLYDLCANQLTPQLALDAAYAAKRLNDNDLAATYFGRAVELDQASAPRAFDRQTTFNLRREVESLTREFGVNGTLAYRAARPQSAGGNVGQAIAEAYWQPKNIGNNAGRILQTYVRASLNTLAAGGSAVQTDSTQGAIGVRYKPFGDVNMVMAGERLFKIGSGATKDWLMRVGYSASLNSDIGPITGVSPIGQVYAEAGYLLNQGRTLGVVEGRYGWEKQVFAESQNLRALWFVNGTVNYDSGERRTTAAAFGPGVGVRYWFRESALRAPASYMQLDVIYRLSATKDKRAGGLAIQLSFGL